jgi:cephalosporin hydroxylase
LETVRQKIFKERDPYHELPVLALDMQGWSSESPVFRDIISELQPKLIIEVGSWKGASAIHMAKTCLEFYSDFEIVCIDTWLGSVEHWTGDQSLLMKYAVNGRPNIYQQFLSNVYASDLQEYITPFPIDSLNGAEVLARLKVSADFIYVDAGHEYLSVRNDFTAYSALLREGGYLLGDDWNYQPVKDAAIDSFNEDKIIDKGDKFLWIK